LWTIKNITPFWMDYIRKVEKKMKTREISEEDLFLIMYHNKQISIEIDYEFLKIKMINELLERLEKLMENIEDNSFEPPWFIEMTDLIEMHVLGNMEEQMEKLKLEKENIKIKELKTIYEIDKENGKAIFWYD